MSLLGKGVITGNTESSAIAHRGGDAQLSVGGTFGGATVTPWTSQDGGVKYFPIVDAAFTQADQIILDLVNECLIKLVVTGGTNAVIDYAVSIEE